MKRVFEVVSELRKLYPNLEILVWQKSNKAHLLVNEKVIFKFDPDFMEKSLEKFGEDAMKETVKMWAEYVHLRYIKRLNRFKRESGRPGLGFTEGQIRFARLNSKSNNGAAKFLNVSLNTYKKYAQMYNLYEDHKNQAGKKILKSGRTKKSSWEDIFANKHTHYPLQHLKTRLIEDLIIEEKCEMCGYNTRRSFDSKMAIVLDFKDGNDKNMARENMRFLCYNCKFNTGKRLSKKILDELQEMADAHKEEEENKKVEQVWNELNPEKETPQNAIIQTNTDQIDDIWKQYNK